MDTEKHKLPLTELHSKLSYINPEYSKVLAQAAGVCFEDQSHPNGVELQVDGEYKAKYEVYWPLIDDNIRNCWSDEQYATEHGAYGVAFLLILDLTEYTVIERSRKGTGFDYWLGKVNQDGGVLFQDKARLEVSGIRNGDLGQVRSRTKEKTEQVNPTNNTGLPAYIVVVEFGSPRSRVAKK